MKIMTNLIQVDRRKGRKSLYLRVIIIYNCGNILCLLHLWEIRCYICGKFFMTLVGNSTTLVKVIAVVGNFITLSGSYYIQML